MAKFIAIVSHKGPITAEYLEQPAPDPAMFGLPTEDDGSRDDVLLGQNLLPCTSFEPDVDALRAASTRIVLAAGAESEGQLAHRGAHAVAERLGTTPGDVPLRPRRVPRRRVRPDGAAGAVRGPPAGGARRRGMSAPRAASTVGGVEQRWLDEQQQQTWRAWLTLAELLPRTLDAQLQRDAGISHAAYVVLAMLSEAPDRSRRMSDLARRANQSQSRLSHTVARLEERGWVRRERSAEDGRGALAVLTDAGWDVVREVAPGHVDAVREAMFGPLTDEQARALGEALQADRRAARSRPQPAGRARRRRPK